MEIFLPAEESARVRIGAEGRIAVDYEPNRSVQGYVSFVSPEAQFTPKQVETRSEREKLMFRVKVRIDPAVLEQNLARVKTGVTGVAYVRLGPDFPDWPESLQVRLPK